MGPPETLALAVGSEGGEFGKVYSELNDAFLLDSMRQVPFLSTNFSASFPNWSVSNIGRSFRHPSLIHSLSNTAS